MSATLPRLDHVCVAVPRCVDALHFVGAALGSCRPVKGGGMDTIRGGHVAFANDGMLELLEPPTEDSFLEAFLQKHGGPAINHVTFVVPSVQAVVARAESLGIGVSLMNLAQYGYWDEAFFNPKDTLGIVVQVGRIVDWRRAEEQGWHATWDGFADANVPAWAPCLRVAHPHRAASRHIMPQLATPCALSLLGPLLVARSRERAMRVFGDLLGGTLLAPSSPLSPVMRFAWPNSALHITVRVDPEAAREGAIALCTSAPTPLAPALLRDAQIHLGAHLMQRVRAVIFDLGGVVFDSPLHAIRAFEQHVTLERNVLGRLIVAGGDRGAFAQLERGELSAQQFARAFLAEINAAGARPADGHALSEAELLGLCRAMAAAARPRPAMQAAIALLRERGYQVAAITNNWRADGAEHGHYDPRGEGRGPKDTVEDADEVALHAREPSLYDSRVPPLVAAWFDVVIESARVGVRKPDARIFRMCCERLGALPEECVFLDDLAHNLRGAQRVGFAHTILVRTAADALAQLECVLGVPLPRPTLAHENRRRQAAAML